MNRSQTAPDLLDATRKAASAGSSSSAIKANYGPLRHRLLKLTPSNYHCKFFCGGIRCKYCNPEYMPKDQQAIDGLYSTWITENILAMSRPTTEAMAKFGIIKNFHTNGIKSVINLQRVFEHQECGPALDKSGFSYDSEDFMKNHIFHYNFGWPDFGVASLSALLDMVKVLKFALSQGKVAIHCHAGLGRTGVLICCFLIWSQDLSDKEAVEYVRQKRPCSVQTPEQVKLVEQFNSLWNTVKPVFRPDQTFEDYLQQQQMTLHGSEGRVLKFIPKIAFVIGEKLFELYGVNDNGTLENKLKEMASGQNVKFKKLISRKTMPLIEDSLMPAGSVSGSSETFVCVQNLKNNLLSTNFPSSVNRGSKLPPLMPPVSNDVAISNGNTTTGPQSANFGKIQQKCDDEKSTSSDPSKFLALLNKIRNPDLDSVKAAQRYREVLNTGNTLTRWDALLTEESPLVLMLLLMDWFRGLKNSIFFGEELIKHQMDRKFLKNNKWIVWYVGRMFNILCQNNQNCLKEAAKLMAEMLCWNSKNVALNNFVQSAIENADSITNDK